MDHKPKPYVAPRVVDHGTLVDLTRACAHGQGGDAAYPSGSANGITFGRSSPQYGCTSN
jgi:hypothetical protein